MYFDFDELGGRNILSASTLFNIFGIFETSSHYNHNIFSYQYRRLLKSKWRYVERQFQVYGRDLMSRYSNALKIW